MAQIEKKDTNSKEEKENENDIINNFKYFYDLNPENIIISNPYNFNSAIEKLEKLTVEDFTNNINELVQKEVYCDYYSNKNSKNFSINNIFFMTSKLYSNKNEYILLNNFKEEDYIMIPKFPNESKEIIKTGMNIKIYTKEDGKKDINIKCIIRPYY